MSNIERQIEIVKDRLETISESEKFSSDNIFWSLMRGRTPTQNRSVKNVIFDNNYAGDFTESVELLEKQIRIAHETGEKSMHVRVYSTESLKGNFEHVMPINIREAKKQNGFAGLGSVGGNGLLPYLGALHDSNQQIQLGYINKINQLEKKIDDDRYNRQIDELKSEIAGLREDNKSTAEKLINGFKEFADSQMGAALGSTLGGLGQLLIPKMLGMDGGASLAGLGNTGGAMPQADALTDDEEERLELLAEFEEIYEADLTEWLRMQIFYAQYFPEEFEKHQARILTKCQKKQKLLEKEFAENDSDSDS